ncbi:hypothetical protein ACSBR1_026321 [Camellia fascicularis]
MATFPSFDLVIQYKGKVGRVYNVDPDMYCHVDLLKDIHESVLSNIGLNEALVIHSYYDIPSTDKKRMLENDLDVLDMFYMQMNGDGDVEGDDEYHMDDFVGFSGEDKDWNENVATENDYDSTNDAMVYDVSANDDLDDESNYRPKMRNFKGKQFYSSYDDKEPYLNPQGEVVLEKGMIFADVNNFRAALKEYRVETGFKIVRDKNKKSRVTAYYAIDGCP